jgi:hypothetical protein
MIVIATCHIENCGNSGHGIEILSPEDLIICGPCGQEITDKVALDG